MKFPKFMPYPKAWGQAIALIIEFIPVTISGKILNALFFNNLTPEELENIFSEPVALRFIAMIGSIHLALIIYWLAIANQFIFDDPLPKFKYLPRWRNLWTGMINFLVMMFSFPLAIIITAALNEGFDFTEGQIYLCLGIMTIIICAYFFHLGNLLFRKYPNKQQSKAEPRIDPIEQDLNSIKSELGLQKMNDVKKYD